jgi:hypothetical protein
VWWAWVGLGKPRNHFAKNDTSKFEKQSFLTNVRESLVLDLQKQLVRDLLQEDVKSTEDMLE